MIYLSYIGIFFYPNADTERKSFIIERGSNGYIMKIDRLELELGSLERNVKLIGLSIQPPFEILSSEGLNHVYAIGFIQRQRTHYITNEDISPDLEFLTYIKKIEFIKRALKYLGYRVDSIESPWFNISEGNFNYRTTKHGYIFIGD